MDGLIRVGRLPGILAGILTVAFACSGEGSSPGTRVEVDGAWVRAMPLSVSQGGTGTNSAAYLLLRNLGSVPDRLLGGETSVASALELHESREEGGVMRMRPVDGIDLPAGGRVELRPGGLHIMLLGLSQPLTEGDTVEMTLRFQEGGALVVRAPVRALGPS